MKRALLLICAVLCGLGLSAQSLVPQRIVEKTPQTDVVYRLPFNKGVECVARSLTAVRLDLARHYNLVDFCAWELVATTPSSVVAPRGGVVEAVTDGGLLIRHDDGTYTRLRGVMPTVQEGDSVAKGEVVASPDAESEKTSVWMEVFYLTPNPNYGTVALSGNNENLIHYINPLFSSRGERNGPLTNGNHYTVKTRTWCWFWE